MMNVKRAVTFKEMDLYGCQMFIAMTIPLISFTVDILGGVFQRPVNVHITKI